MNDVVIDYEAIIEKFLKEEMTVEEFQGVYLDHFKNEQRDLCDPLYEILEELFGDVDSFTDDSELLADDPAFYLDELALRKKASSALKRLASLR